MQVSIQEQVHQYVLYVQQVSTLRLQEVRSVLIAQQIHTAQQNQVHVLIVSMGDTHHQDRQLAKKCDCR